jgi:uncharacterized protein YaaW (UPF0174 family)
VASSRALTEAGQRWRVVTTGRLAQRKVGAAGMVPTLCFVLGPIGQSITAVNLLARTYEALGTVSVAPTDSWTPAYARTGRR